MRRLWRVALVAGMLASACGTDDDRPAVTAGIEASSTEPPATDPPVTGPSSTEPPATGPPTALDKLGYTVSDDWIVETVIADIDSGTGGLAIDADGVMYLGDFGYTGHRGMTVHRITPDGVVDAFATSDDMESLTMTTFGDDGTLYQSSYNSDRVFAIDPDGTVRIVAEGIRGPTGIVVLDDGTLVVEAYDADTIHKILPDGTVTDWVFDRRFVGLNGLTIGPDGTIYAIDHGDGGLFAIDADGQITDLHEFPSPTAHVVYSDGSLFVTSRSSYVVYRYDLATGEVEVIAGNGEPDDRDGRGAESSFGSPNAITLGPDGALYINHGDGADSSPVTIRRISLSP